MAVEIGALRALLSLDSAQFVKGVKIAKGSLGDFQHRMQKVSKSAAAMGKKLSASITLPMAGLATVAVKTSLSTVDAQAKLAKSLDTTVASMQVLSRAGELAGVSVSGLEQLSKDLTRRLSQAAEGGGPAADALTRLGLSAEGLLSMPLDERIATINTAIGEFIPKAEQAAVAGKLFGEEGSIAASRLDPATIKAASDEVQRFGVTVSQVDAAKIESANDALSSIALAVKGLANQLTVALAPVLETVANKLADAVAWFSELSPGMKRAAGIAAVLAAAAGPVLIAIGGLAAAASFAAGGIALIGGAIAAVLSPVGLLVAAVAGAGVLIYRNWEDISAKFPAITGAITTAISNMKEAFSVQIEGMIKVGKHLLASLEALFSGDFSGVISGLSGAFVAVRETIVATLDALLGQIDEKLFALASETAQKIRQAFNDAVTAVTEFKDRVVAEVIRVAAEISIAAQEIGKNLIEGVKAGLTARWESTKASITNLGGQVSGWFKSKLGIQSPSKVFKGFGQNIADGLIVGLDGKNGAVSKAVGGLSDTVLTVGDSLEGIGASAAQAGSGIANMVDVASGKLGQLKSQAEQVSGAVGGALYDFAGNLVKGDASSAFKNLGSSLKNVAADAFSGAIKTAFSAGGGGLSGLFSGFGAGLKSFGSGIGSLFSGGGLSGLSSAIGGIMPVIGAGLAIFNLIKGFSSKELIGGGLKLGVNSGKVAGGTYETFKKTSWWGLSEKIVEEMSAFGGKAAAAFQTQIGKVQDGVSGAFKALGITVSDKYLQSISFAIQKIETKGKNNKQISDAVKKVFAGYGDALAQAAGNVSLNWLNNIIRVDAVLGAVGKSFDIFGAKVSGFASKVNLKPFATAAAVLNKMAGGFDQLYKKTNSFFDLFYSDAEKLDLMRDQIAGVFGDLKLSIPETNAAYRALLEAQDLMTHSGRKAYVALLDLAPVFKTVTDATEQAAAALVEQINTLRGAYNLNASGFATEWEARLADELSNPGRYENELLNMQNASLIRQEALLQSIDNRLRKQGNATLDSLTLSQMGAA